MQTLKIHTRGGGGGYSPQILVGMCHGKGENGGLRIELAELEHENTGLRNGLEDTSGWHSGRPLTPEHRGKVKNAGFRTELRELGWVSWTYVGSQIMVSGMAK